MTHSQAVSRIWDYSKEGRRAVRLGESDVPSAPLPEHLEREEAAPLPEVSELDLVRHYTRLSQLNYSIDTHYYPLGSCTMKYNPRQNEDIAALPSFSRSHPYQGESESQGLLELLYELSEALKEISGFTGVSLQPAAGAHGELTGVLMIRAYHEKNKDVHRTKILIPDSAHGTNPATVTMAGFEAVEIPSGPDGLIDTEALKGHLDGDLAGIMVTNPNTLGLFEKNITEVTRLVHEAGGLVYGDGANMNALLGIVRPAALGFDVMHFNLHQTFATPHGGGGPGAGPVAANETLKDFLPGPVAARKEKTYTWEAPASSIGRVKAFNGNMGVLIRAWAYIRSLGAEGLKEVSEAAVLNANYLKGLVKEAFPAEYPGVCMHEFVTSGAIGDVHTLDIAKRLIDYGFHPPTVYFPLIVKEAMMIEPTETESRETLEAFAQALLSIAREASEQPELVHSAPHNTPVGRLDEVAAVRKPILKEVT